MHLSIPLTYDNVINNLSLVTFEFVFYTVSITSSCKFLVIVFLKEAFHSFIINDIKVTTFFLLLFSLEEKCYNTTQGNHFKVKTC